MHLLARWVLHPPGTERALSSSSEETSRVWRGPKTLGLRPISASSARATRRLLLARANRPRHGHGTRRLALTATRRPHAFSVRQCRLAPTAEPGLAAGPALPFALTAMSRRASPLRTRTPKQNPRARSHSAWCLWQRQLNSRFLGSSATRDPRSDSRLRRAGLRFGRGLRQSAAWSKVKPGPRRRAPVDHF